jgi:hypothetical protein
MKNEHIAKNSTKVQSTYILPFNLVTFLLPVESLTKAIHNSLQ